MKQPVFALIDCNNFFVSCMRVFRPDLKDRPVVALSSNDGCVVARSNEAKALGIPMGAPVFKWRQFFKSNNVMQFSGNFELYGDMSRRIVGICTSITPHTEVYSVDESFLDLSELNISNLTTWGQEVKKRIMQWTGIPVSIGIAGSKTLAKLASERAKKDNKHRGVLDLYSLNKKERRPFLDETPIKDVWGIGWRLTPKLQAEQLFTASHVADLLPRYAQSLMGIHGRQLVTELNGESCLPLKRRYQAPQSIANTRTFGEDTNDPNVLEAAMTSFIAKVTRQLRDSHQLTTKAGYFMATNRHRPGYIMKSELLSLPFPTADNGFLNQFIMGNVRRSFSYSQLYHRAGVWIQDFIPDKAFQASLFEPVKNDIIDASEQRMQAIDTLNSRYGKHAIHYAAEDLAKSWQPKRKNQMPRYTTRWEELPIVKTL